MKYTYILLISLSFLNCRNNESKLDQNLESQTDTNEIIITKAQFESEQMLLDTLKHVDFSSSIQATGMIDVPPKNKASVSTFIGGYVTKTPLLVGDQVKKGQSLVSLKNPEYVEMQQKYLEIAEQLSYLKSEYNRQKTLYDEQISSEKKFLKAQSAYKSSLATYNGLRKKLQMINIDPKAVEQGHITSTINLYAPISGHVAKINVSNGTYVSPNDVVLEIVDMDHVHLELSVFEKDVMHIKKGQKIIFKIPEASPDLYEAEVHLVAATVDEKSRRVKVHGHVDDEDKNFVVGMFVEADIVTEQTSKLALPKDAVVDIDGNAYILVLEQKENDVFHFKKTKIDIGLQDENYIEILNPKSLENKQILIEGIGMLL